MALKDRIKKAYVYHGLNVNTFAETGSFTPKSTLTPRDITVSVAHRTNDEETDATRDRREFIEIFFVKDDGTVGVTDLYQGDSYVRDSAFDADDRPYVFYGEISEQGRDYILAVFERTKRTSQGRGT